MSNIVILTFGLSGSSVLTGALVHAGWWCGESMRKPDYDTHENRRLIELNRRIMRAVGFNEEPELERSRDIARECESVSDPELRREAREFVRECGGHAPWVWKDPRLRWTLGYWLPLLEQRDVRFIMLTRNWFDTWVSLNLRRHVQTPWATRQELAMTSGNVQALCERHGLALLRIEYARLVQYPVSELASVSDWVGAAVTEGDLVAVHREDSCGWPCRLRRSLLAGAILVKNFGQRRRMD